MKRYILFSIVAATFCGCSGCHAQNSVEGPTATSTNEFSLACVVDGNTLKCVLRNTATNSIHYSSYTIGYHEAVVLERYDADSSSWVRVQWRDPRSLFLKSAGASLRDVKSVASGTIVPPEHSVEETPAYSFVVRLENYDLPASAVHHLRVTQVMGTLLGSDLPVWKGRVVSDRIEYRPNQAMDSDKK